MVRATQQRNAIRKALVSSGRPLSVGEILELAQSEIAGLGIATVYRNLKALQEEGWIARVDLPGQSPRWEIAPENHHHHFLCQTCDKVFEIYGCPEGLKNLLPNGYTLAEHEILLRGKCDVCSGKYKSHAKLGMIQGSSR
jgi:Fur family transcriptional regulator, ferric uptake regulator